MATLTLDMSGRGGLAPKFWGDIDRTVPTPNLRYLGGDDQMAEGFYNPMRRYGYLSPINTTFDTVGSLGSIATCSIYDSINNDIYFGTYVADIYKIDTLDGTTASNEIDFGANTHVFDMEIYQVNGVRKLFTVMETGTNVLEVAISSLPYNTATDDLTWLTATVTGAFSNTLTGQAFMEVADNGLAYLFQDNVVHKIDGTTAGGTNGTITANILTFPTYYRCVDAVDYRGLMFIAVHQYSYDMRSGDEVVNAVTQKVGVYLWDRNVALTSIRDIIPIGGAKEIRRIYVSPSGKVRIIVINSERVTEIREYNGSTFEVIQEVGLKAYPPFRDSLTTFGTFTTWLGRDGIFYAHGKVSPNDKEALYKIGKITDLSANSLSIGAILFGGETTGSIPSGYKAEKHGIFFSYYDGADYIVKGLDIHGTGTQGAAAASIQGQGDVYTLVKYLPQMSTVNDIEIFMAPGTGSGSTTVGTVKIYFNQSATAWASKVVTRDESARGYKRIEVNKPFINSIQLEVEFPTDVACGTLDFAPSVAIMEYTASNAKG